MAWHSLFGTEYWLARFAFQRGLALIYLIAFLVAFRQFRAICRLSLWVRMTAQLRVDSEARESVNYVPVHLGVRLLRKASMPSRKSRLM